MSHISLNILPHKLLITLCWVGILFCAERVSQNFTLPEPLCKDGIVRWLINITLGFINKLLLPFATLPLVIFFTTHEYFHRPTTQTGLIYLLVDIMILDLSSYFFHVISHKFPVLWQFHRAHHSDKAFDVTTGLRIHFGELLIANLFRGLPIILLGIPLKSVLIFELLLAIEGLFHHSNIKLPAKVSKLAGYVITMPDRHAVHHHSLRSDTDSNFGFIFIWWDKLFGSFNSACRTEEWVIGLEECDDQTILEILARPFIWIAQSSKNLLSRLVCHLKYINEGNMQ